MKTLIERLPLLALLLWVGALLVLGARLAGYSQLQHPVAWPGAEGLSGAAVFNALVFVLPGALMTMSAWRLRGKLPTGAGAVSRVATSLLLLSALAFLAQGLLPLDPDALDAGNSRAHAGAWTVWWIALLAGSAALSIRLRRLRASTLGLWLAVCALGVLLPQLLGAGISQRLAFAAWFAWTWWAERALRATPQR